MILLQAMAPDTEAFSVRGDGHVTVSGILSVGGPAQISGFATAASGVEISSGGLKVGWFSIG